MKNPINYFEQTMDDIVFEQRNKTYGAYQLRQNSNRFLSVALLGTLVLALSLSAFSLTHKADAEIALKKVEAAPSDLPKFPVERVEIKVPPIETHVQPKTATQAFAEMQIRHDNQVNDNADPVRIDAIGDKQIDLVSHDKDPVGDPVLQVPVFDKPVVMEKKTFLAVEQMPEFKGGTAALYNWLGSHIVYPREARVNGIEGTVYIQFVVDESGTIADCKVVRGIGFGCDEEALKWVSKMPVWTPGKQQGVPVRVQFTLPVTFKTS